VLNLSQTFWFHRTFFKLYKEYEAYVIIRNFIEQSTNDLMRPFNLFIQTEIFEKENNDFITLFYLQLQTLTNRVFEKGNT